MSDSPFIDTVPHGFDVLNLHTHGMHVSPKAYSDNVLLNLFPDSAPDKVVSQCKKQLKGDPITKNMCAKGKWPMLVQLPNKHPSGSYWYHTHKHGAVALQLASGISGAIIVQDYKNGLESLPGVEAVVKTAGEKIMLIQQIPFATPVTSGASSSANATPPIPVVNCWGVYGNPVSCKGSQPIVPNTTNSQLSVNGQFNAVVTMQTNEAQLWRLVNTTPANVMPVCLIPLNGTGSSSSSSAVAPSAPALYVLAADGNPVAIPKPKAKQLPFQLGSPVFDVVSNPQGLVNNEFQFLAPGQRLDLMVKAPAQPGQYVLWNGGGATQMSQLCPSSLSVSDLGSNQSNLVAFVNVITAPANSGVNKKVPSQADLNNLYLPKPVNTASDTPAAPTQGVVFGFTNVSFSPDDKNNGTKSKIGGTSVINGRPFYEGQVQRRLQLNQADRWSVQSAADTHMFHIHTNPFQILTRGNLNYPFPVWRDTALINCSPAASGFNDGSYQNCTFPAGLTKQFMSPSNSGASSSTNSSNSNQSYVANNGKYGEILQFVSRAVDFTGAIVMHCHNTEHEDNGMMELVEITD
jgi:FtsP/CotA-like multicopper oxidase with cupredoxin domain